MNPFTGTFPAAVQIGTAALDRLLDRLVTTGGFPTVFLRGTPGNPLPRDLYLWNLRTAIPDGVPGVPNALALEFSWIMQGELNDTAGWGSGSAAGSLTAGPQGELLLDFSQVPLDAVQIEVSEEGAPWSAAVVQAGFWAGLRERGAFTLVGGTGRPVDARVLAGPDGRALHLCVGLPGTQPTPPGAPPSVLSSQQVALIVPPEAILPPALQAVLQLTAEWKFGSRMIYDSEVVLDSFEWTWAPPFVHGHGTAHYQTEIWAEFPATFSMNLSFYLSDPPQAWDDRLVQLGIGDVNVDVAWWADLVAAVFLTPTGGIPLVESIEHRAAQKITNKSNQKLAQAFADLNPLQKAGPNLRVRNETVHLAAEGLVLRSTVLEQVGEIDPIDRIPALLGNKRSKVFHRPDCVYGMKVFDAEKFRFDASGVTAARAKYNGCWTCLRQWHRRAAGDVTVIVRAEDLPEGTPGFPLRLAGEPIELFDDDGLGVREPFVKDVVLTPEDGIPGVALMKTKLLQLAAGRWKIVAGTALLPSWSAQGERRVSKGTPAPPLYFRTGHPGGEPVLSEPLDPGVPPANVRLAVWLRGFTPEELQGRLVVFIGKLTRPAEAWGEGVAELAKTLSVPLAAAWVDATTVEVSFEATELLPGEWHMRATIPGVGYASRGPELAPGSTVSLHMGTWQRP